MAEEISKVKHTYNISSVPICYNADLKREVPDKQVEYLVEQRSI